MSFNYKIVQGNLVITDPTGKVTDIVQNLGNRLKTENILADGPQLDAFGRLRTASPNVVFNAYFTVSDQAFLFSEKTVGGGSITRNTTAGRMEYSVGTASGDRAVRQTKQYFFYLSGLSAQILSTFLMGDLTANCNQRIGLYDDSNGLFLEARGTTVGVVLRSSTSGTVSDTFVPQSSWNLDKMDGTGESGITVDWTNQQILSIDMQWLGAGRVRYGLVIDGKTYHVHEILNANEHDIFPYMNNPTLPIRYEVVNTGTTATPTTLLHVCSSYIREAAESQDAETRFSTENTGTNSKNVSQNNPTTLIGIRYKAGFERSNIEIKNVSVLAASNDDLLIEIVLNPTVVGEDFIAGNSDILDIDTASTTNTGGIVISSFYLKTGESFNLPSGKSFSGMFSDIDGVSDRLYVRCQALQSSASVFASINLLEKF